MRPDPARVPARRGRLYLASLLGVGLLTLGCARIKVWMGLRIPLERVPAVSVAAALAEGPALAPGDEAHLVVTVRTADGRVLVTEGAGGGQVRWSDLELAATVASVSAKGRAELAKDPRTSDGRAIRIEVSVPSHPGVRAELQVPIRYDRAFTSTYHGAAGLPGSDGSPGWDGGPGMPGNSDPANPQAGGAGGDGTGGGDGQDGWPGGDGPAVHVWATLHPDRAPLVQVKVQGDRAPEYFLVDPRGGSLTVASSGGPGGSGGHGGRGGPGGSGGHGGRGGPGGMGGSGWPPGPGGSSGRDGGNGQDGASGRGGPITVSYDPSVTPWLAVIRWRQEGVSGPVPVYLEEPVARLW